MSARDRLLDLLTARGSLHASLAVSGTMVKGTAVMGYILILIYLDPTGSFCQRVVWSWADISMKPLSRVLSRDVTFRLSHAFRGWPMKIRGRQLRELSYWVVLWVNESCFLHLLPYETQQYQEDFSRLSWKTRYYSEPTDCCCLNRLPGMGISNYLDLVRFSYVSGWCNLVPGPEEPKTKQQYRYTSCETLESIQLFLPQIISERKIG